MRQWPFFFKFVRLLVVLVGWLISATVVDAQSNQVLIIANAALSIERIDEGDLTRIYLLRQTSWADGSPIIVLNREANSAIRELFTSQVLKQTATALASHWQQMHFKGKTPPLIQESDQAVLVFVEKVAGAIGYINSDTPITHHVKVLAKLP